MSSMPLNNIEYLFYKLEKTIFKHNNFFFVIKHKFENLAPEAEQKNAVSCSQP